MASSRAKILSRIRAFSPGLPHYLFAGVFVLRLVVLLRFSMSASFLPARGDMHFYNDWAQRICRGELSGGQAFYGLPLYPYLLALFYKVFGFSPFIPALFQTAFDAGTAVLIYELFRRVFPRPNGTGGKPAQLTIPNEAQVFGAVAAAAWAVYVPAASYSVILMPTAPFVFAFWFVVWRVLRSENGLGAAECFLLGLLIGVTAMGVATILFLIPLLIGALFFRSRAHRMTLPVAAAALLLGTGIGTAPCWIHNYFVARDPVFLSAHSGVNFWIGNNPIANGYPRFPPGLRAGQAAMLEDSITAAETAAGHPLKRAEVSAYWSAQAEQYITRHWGEWLRLLLRKLRNFWSAFQYDDLSIITNFREEGVTLPGLYFGVVAAFALPGMLFAGARAPLSRWIAAAVLLQMIALLTVFITERYRLAAVPGLIVLATFGLALFWRGLLLRHYVETGVFVLLLISSAILVSWPQRSASLWSLDAYNSGWQALESRNFALAEQKLSLAQRYVPTNPETNFALGNLRLAQERYKAAFQFYLTTLKYDANHRGALNNLGVMAFDARNYDVAEKWLRRSQAVDPNDAKTHFLLAKALFAKGNREGAAAEIDEAVRLQPAQREFRNLEQEIRSRR